MQTGYNIRGRTGLAPQSVQTNLGSSLLLEAAKIIDISAS